MKKILSILLALTLVLALAACASGNKDTSPSPSPSESAQPSDVASPSAEETPADDDWSYIKEKGELVIGYTDYAPMNYMDDSGKLIGFDTEYAEALCAKLGVTPIFKIIIWDSKEIELAAKTIDCIWNGMTVTEERRENMAFTTSYVVNEQVVVVKADNASKYADKASLSGVVVVAESGSAGQDAVEADLPDAVFTAVDTQSSALLEVKAGTAEAAVIDATMAESMTGEGTDYSDLVIITSIDLMDEEYAIGMRLGSTAVDVFNKATDELLADGTLPEIAEKYGLGDRLISK